MVISTYQDIGGDKGAKWYSGQIMGVSQALVKIQNGPWIQIDDLGQGEYKISYPGGCQHGRPSEVPSPNVSQMKRIRDVGVCQECGCEAEFRKISRKHSGV